MCECNLILLDFKGELQNVTFRNEHRAISKTRIWRSRRPSFIAVHFINADRRIESAIVRVMRYWSQRLPNGHSMTCLCIDAIYGTGESVILVAIRPSSTICFRKRVVNQDGHRWSTIANISLACCRGSPLANDGFKRDKFQWLCRYIFLQLFVTQLQR